MKILTRKVYSFIDTDTQEDLHTVSSEILANILRKDHHCDEINILGEIEHYLKPLTVFRNENDYGHISEETKKIIYTTAQKFWTEISTLHKPENIADLATEVIKNTPLDDVDFEADISSVLKNHVNGVYALAKDTPYFRNLITDIKNNIISRVHPTYIIYPKKTITEDVAKLYSHIESYKGPNKVVAAIATFFTGISFIQLSSIINTLRNAGISFDSLFFVAKQDPIGFVGMLAIPAFFIVKTITTTNTLRELFSQGKKLVQQYVHPKNFSIFLEAINKKTGNTRINIKQYIKYSLYAELQHISKIQKNIDSILQILNTMHVGSETKEAVYIMQRVKRFLHLWLHQLPKDSILYNSFAKMLKNLQLGNIQEEFDKLTRIVIQEKKKIEERITLFDANLEYPEDNNLKVHYSVINILLSTLKFTLKPTSKTTTTAHP